MLPTDPTPCSRSLPGAARGRRHWARAGQEFMHRLILLLFTLCMVLGAAA